MLMAQHDDDDDDDDHYLILIIRLHTVEWFKVLLSHTNNSIYYRIRTQLSLI